jgi:glycosyltransferase involved in cell wall biosynthesis
VKPKLYIFGWPSFLGGADTKLAHLIVLLQDHFDLTVVPNEKALLDQRLWTDFLGRHNARYAAFDDLPKRLEGVGLALSNECFFINRIAHRASERGLKIVWSSEMMWHHHGELEAVQSGLIDKVLYTSETQKAVLEPGYGNLPWTVTGNYIDPVFFPFCERRNRTFTIGRLSRPALEKYPEDFPVFYERLDLPDTRFRVMAWSEALHRQYAWHRFDWRWDLLAAEEETQVSFLHSLDLFVYPLGHDFWESWGRSTVEAMLTGCIPLASPGDHLENLVIHGETGFICADFLIYKECAHSLYFDYQKRRKMAAACREHAAGTLCNKERHLKTWIKALECQ